MNPIDRLPLQAVVFLVAAAAFSSVYITQPVLPVLALGLLLSLLPSPVAIGLALAAVCAGYFGVHASAVGTLNLRLSSGRGRANALYVLFYYAGGFSGITVSGYAYSQGGWSAVIVVCLAVLTGPIVIGLVEHRARQE